MRLKESLTTSEAQEILALIMAKFLEYSSGKIRYATLTLLIVHESCVPKRNTPHVQHRPPCPSLMRREIRLSMYAAER